MCPVLGFTNKIEKIDQACHGKDQVSFTPNMSLGSPHMIVTFSGKQPNSNSGILWNGVTPPPKGPYKLMGNSSSVASALSPDLSLLVCHTQPAQSSNPYGILASIGELSDDDLVVSGGILVMACDFVLSMVSTPDMLSSSFVGSLPNVSVNASSADRMHLASSKHNFRCMGSASSVDCQPNPLTSYDVLVPHFHTIVDSGATSHMVPFCSAFTQYHAMPGGYVVLADKTQIPSVGIGMVRYQLGSALIELTHVLHISSLHASLFSVC